MLILTASTNTSQCTFISNKLINLNDFSTDMDKNQNKTFVTGEDELQIILFIPTKLQVTLAEALNDAFVRAPDTDYIRDANVQFGSFWFPYIYGQAWWKVEGTAVKSR